MRTAVWRVNFATFSLASDPPVPIAATLAFPGGAWSVQFDKILQSGALDAANWSFRATGNSFAGLTAVAAGAIVSGTSGPPVEDAGSDVANYGPPPFDVLDAEQRPALAFSDFPLVVT